VLALADGSRVEAFADTSLQLPEARDASEKRVVLEEGELEVAAVRQAAGHSLVVETGQAETRVVGTRFRLASGAAATHLEVQEGAVRCRRKADGATIGKTGWKPGGLAIQVPAKFDPSVLPGKARDGIARSGEFTLEMWVAWEQGNTAPAHHLVVTRSATGDVQLFVDGVPVASDGAPRDPLGAANYFLQELRRRQNAARAKEVILRLAAAYGRALTAAEVQQNQQAGAD
jgi:hypothetical protein